MKLLVIVSLLFSALGFHSRAAILTQEDLLSAAYDADSIVCIRIDALPKPQVSIISLWKGSFAQELSIRQSINTFISEHPYLNPPKYDQGYLLFCKTPVGDNLIFPATRVTSVDIENHCLLFGRHKLPLSEAKRLIRKSLNEAEQGAAANP